MESVMACSGLNFWLKFRLLPLFFLVVFVSAQADPKKGFSFMNDQEEKIFGIFSGPTFPNRLLDSTTPVELDLYVNPVVLGKLKKFHKNQPFTPTLNKHNDLAHELAEIFINAPDIDTVEAIGKFLNNDVSINQSLLMHALALALMHRPDSNKIRIGRFFTMNPSVFLDSRFQADINRAVPMEGNVNEPIDIWGNYSTASDREPEHRLAYFREDLGINLHHWHWHLVYPYNGLPRIVIKDRRGELFYYLHHQIIARYNAERLCNQLSRVKRLHDFNEPIEEAYFSKLDNTVASRSWPSRPSGMILRDIDRPDDNEYFDVQDLERWSNRLYEAIYTRSITHRNGTVQSLDERSGIDVLGNAVEASPLLSPNVDYYGQLHNSGHTAIAFIHDPDGRHMEQFSIMGQPATAMRDPIFYRWHTYMNELFLDHKNTLTPYTVEELGYPEISVCDVHVVENKATDGVKNHLNTFWDWHVVPLGRRADFELASPSEGFVFAKFTHLNHNAFSYKFTITSTAPSRKTGVVRIFIAPQLDERGVPFPFGEQKKLMIEMDNFKILIPPGTTSFVRNSTASSVTIPFSSASHSLTALEIPSEGAYAGCGWPQHMLLPKGTKDGFPMDLFLMVSDDFGSTVIPKQAFTFCGLRGEKYPDVRSMGYPFDRKVNADTLSEFLLPNMATAKIKVQFTDDFLAK